MKAECPNGWAFTSRAGKARCECPAGTELARDAAGNWACAPACSGNAAQLDCYTADRSCPVGNPVLPATATKVQTETDYSGAGTDGLNFIRTFRSRGARPFVAKGGWANWTHNWARRVETYPEPGYASARAYVLRGDGRQQIFTTPGDGTWTAFETGDRDLLVEERDSRGVRTGFQYRVWADDSVEHYDLSGKLMRVVARNGWTTTLTYSDATTPAAQAPGHDYLISVKNAFGRELRFTYDSAGRLNEFLPPGTIAGAPPGSAASPIRYAYEEPAGLGAGVALAAQLTSVTYQDGATKRYHYESGYFPTWLTGITDELGVRIGTYIYASNGHLRRESGANGANIIDFDYLADSTNVIDRSSGTPVTTTIRWQAVQGLARPVSVSAPCALCGTSQASTAYTATGEVARSVAHDGRITFFKYDTKGRETERAVFSASYNAATTRPALVLAESVTSTKWHATWNLPTQAAEPGKISAFTYNVKGMPTGSSWTATSDATGAAKFAAVKTGSIYATGWGYNANSLNTSIVEKTDGVVVNQWKVTYNARGDVAKITSTEAGTSVVATLIPDAHGRLAQITADTGAISQFDYGPRGLLVRASLPGWSASFTHDPRRSLVRVDLSGGAWINVIYDTLGEPVRVEDSRGQSQPIAKLGLPETGATGPLSRNLIERVRSAALGLRSTRPVQWLPLPEARAQASPAMMQAQLRIAAGLARVSSGQAGQVDGAPQADIGSSCCGANSRQLAVALQQHIRQTFAPLQLIVMAYTRAVDTMADELAILKARDKLRKAMLCLSAAKSLVGCYEAHHIVAFGASIAQPARDILALPAVNIDINSPINGVWVPCGQHKGMHTNNYYEKVNDELNSIPLKNTATVTEKLQTIAARIRANTF